MSGRNPDTITHDLTLSLLLLSLHDLISSSECRLEILSFMFMLYCYWATFWIPAMNFYKKFCRCMSATWFYLFLWTVITLVILSSFIVDDWHLCMNSWYQRAYFAFLKDGHLQIIFQIRFGDRLVAVVENFLNLVFVLAVSMRCRNRGKWTGLAKNRYFFSCWKVFLWRLLSLNWPSFCSMTCLVRKTMTGNWTYCSELFGKSRYRTGDSTLCKSKWCGHTGFYIRYDEKTIKLPLFEAWLCIWQYKTVKEKKGIYPQLWDRLHSKSRV